MRGGSVVATNITKEYGATVVLDRVSLTVPPGARIGVVGPNGSGKSTLLRVLAGVDEPSAGRVERIGTVGYLPQEPERRRGETLLGFLARRTGVAEAEARMERGDLDAVDEFLALGGGDLEPRARKVCAQLGIDVPLDAELPTLSGGEAARVSLAALLLSRFDVLCLDEPTNDLDFDGLERLERFVRALRRTDRPRVPRPCVPRSNGDAHRRVRGRRRDGSPSSPARTRSSRPSGCGRSTGSRPRTRDFVDERGRFEELLGVRREQARHGLNLGTARDAGAQVEGRAGEGDGSSGSTRSRSRGARGGSSSTLSPKERSGDLVARLSGAVVERGDFRLGPIDLDLGWGDRIAIVGPNGAGKTTLLRALLGDVPLAAGRANDRHRCRRRRARPAARALRVGRAAARTLPRRGGAPAAGGADAAREVRHPRRGRAASGAVALTRRAQPRSARAAAVPRRQLPRPRRADEPPRRRGDRAARRGARRLSGHGAARHARPALPRALRSDSYDRAVTLALFDVDGTLLLTPDLVAVRAILDSLDPSLPDDAFLQHDNAGQTALWQVRQILGREPDPGWCGKAEERYRELLGDTSHWRAPDGAADVLAELERRGVQARAADRRAGSGSRDCAWSASASTCFFPEGQGAFGCESDDRVELIRLALERAARVAGGRSRDRRHRGGREDRTRSGCPLDPRRPTRLVRGATRACRVARRARPSAGRRALPRARAARRSGPCRTSGRGRRSRRGRGSAPAARGRSRPAPTRARRGCRRRDTASAARRCLRDSSPGTRARRCGGRRRRPRDSGSTARAGARRSGARRPCRCSRGRSTSSAGTVSGTGRYRWPPYSRAPSSSSISSRNSSPERSLALRRLNDFTGRA